ncbi:aldo/keto reductase [Neisseria chenwenguii]|uniref:aldo/keto reductase n=1 Tax=Neisseria chenwenguii TaxID=1853278 RepID=UPI000F4EFFD7|nr:aldo/keto reductase [Neisseria chenwenguii]ROV54419.1 oxidoreductase [Neisseria chenwenguii]
MNKANIQLAENLTFSRFSHGYWRAHKWQLPTKQYTQLIENVLELGITTFDHAACYGGFTNETAFGNALADNPELRGKMQIVSKCGILFPNGTFPEMQSKHYDNSREHIIWSAERSVRELRCGYLDVLLVHRPSPCADPEEIAAAFDHLHRAGTVRHFGVSNYSPAKLNMLQSYLSQPLVTNQIEISPLHLNAFEQDLDYLLEKRIKPMAWSPLGGGRLFDADNERSRRIQAALLKIGEKYGETRLDTLAYAWLLSHPAHIMPVIGSGRIERIKNAADALKLDFTEEDWIGIYSASMGHDVP